MTVSLAQYRAVLSTYLRPYWKRVSLLVALLFLSTGLTLISPQVLASFIDTLFSGGAIETLVGLALLYLVSVFAAQGVIVGSTYLAADVGLRATNRLRADLTLHCLKLDMGFHNGQTPGALIERIDGDVSNLSNFLSTFSVQLLRSLTLLIGALLALFSVDWRASAVLGVFTLISIVVINRSRDLAVPAYDAEREASANLFGFLEERLSGLEDVRANGATDYVMRGFYERSRAWFSPYVRAHTFSGATWLISSAMFTLMVVIGLASGVLLFQAGAVTLGAVYLIYRYIELLRRPIDEIGRQIQTLQQAGAAILRINRLLSTQPLVADTGETPLPGGKLSVVFENVAFRYPTADESVLEAIDFQLEAGTILGLLGRTGSGKTTLARLLVRLYDPTQGKVRIGGVDLRETPQAELRARVGLVTQDVQLFRATVRQNLTLFDPSLPDSAILDALREIGLWEWFQALPLGLDTLLTPGALSAGEGQLLAFARLLLKNPGVIILDEASSRLDLATEQKVERALDKLLHGRTAIIIAHRLTTVRRAERIMILEDGRIVEHGERLALEADPDSRFARLLQIGIEEALA